MNQKKLPVFKKPYDSIISTNNKKLLLILIISSVWRILMLKILAWGRLYSKD